MGSTSAAAAFVVDSEAADGGCNAAISSVLVGEKHREDLVCVAKNIEDEPGANTTRFLVLYNKKAQPQAPQRSSQPKEDTQVKSLWAFTVAHHQAGALAKTLAVFAKHDYNLSALQSRPRPKPKPRDGEKLGFGANWQYVTFVECLHVTNGSSEAEVASRLLEELKAKLGIWGTTWMDGKGAGSLSLRLRIVIHSNLYIPANYENACVYDDFRFCHDRGQCIYRIHSLGDLIF